MLPSRLAVVFGVHKFRWCPYVFRTKLLKIRFSCLYMLKIWWDTKPNAQNCIFDIKFLPCLLSGSFSLVTTLFSIFLRSLTTWSFQYFIVNSSTSFIARSRFWDCLISLSWPFTTARFLAFKKPYSNALTIMFLFSCCKGSRLFIVIQFSIYATALSIICKVIFSLLQMISFENIAHATSIKLTVWNAQWG